MNKVLHLLWTVLCIAAAIAGIVMMIMAIQFQEYGRFVFYFALSIASGCMAVYPIMKLIAHK